ncbi:MAG TPA: hypothetical protein VJ436_08875 [Anaerolineales bacterium]|nr:hypothetical protein [Anaerolineales bacterium]
MTTRDSVDDRADGLVEDLLHLARGEGGLELNREEIDLAILQADVVDSLRPLAEKKPPQTAL